MFNYADLTITSLDKITAFDILTGQFKFALEELQSATVEQSQEETEITGKQGRRLATLKKNKAISISGTNGVLSGGLMEMQTGCEFENKATTVMWQDYITVTSNKATTTYKAVGTSGAEILGLYTKHTNGTVKDTYTQAASADTLKFAYNPASKEITFKAGEVADGTELYVIYERKITANVLENLSDHYSSKCALYIDAIAEDSCTNVYHVQFYIPKADFDGNFSIAMGDNQTVQEFSASSLAGVCGNSSQGLWTYTVFGADAEDAA